MMREIKFRAWKTWRTGQENMFPARSVLDISSGQFDYRDTILMQYTGLKDKNGVEIYEGDIVKHDNGIKQVYYHEPSYSFQMGLSNVVFDQEQPDDGNIEVIGNIYENGDLLND